MSGAERFLDTNVLLYLMSADPARADAAERELAEGGVVSVQVLNEFASVAMRKLRMPMHEIREVLATIRSFCSVEALTIDTHERALNLVERYGHAFYDASIIAAALQAGCTTLVTEDLQHGQVIDGTLRIANPFKAS